MAVSKNTLLALLLLALNNNVAAFAPAASTRVARSVQQSPPLFSSLAELGEDDVEVPDEDYIVNVGDLEGDDDEDGVEDDGEPPAWFSTNEKVQSLRAEYRRHEKDTGSPEFQVAGMTERIRYLTGHLQTNPKDFSTRRGLVALVNKRRRLLNYLCKEDVDKYSSIVESLGIRHKAPGRVGSREEKYSRFPGQKAVKKHLVQKRK